MKNKKITWKVFCTFLPMVFISITTTALAQEELQAIINNICFQRKIVMEDSFVSGTTFKRVNNKILIFPAPGPSFKITNYIEAKDLSKWNDTSKLFATLSLGLIPLQFVLHPCSAALSEHAP